MDVDKADKQNANPKHVDEYIPDPNGIYRDKGGTVTGRTAITIKTRYPIQHQLPDLRTGIRFTVEGMGYYGQRQCCRVKT